MFLTLQTPLCHAWIHTNFRVRSEKSSKQHIEKSELLTMISFTMILQVLTFVCKKFCRLWLHFGEIPIASGKLGKQDIIIHGLSNYMSKMN